MKGNKPIGNKEINVMLVDCLETSGSQELNHRLNLYSLRGSLQRLVHELWGGYITSGFRLELPTRCWNTYSMIPVKGTAASWKTQKEEYVGYWKKVLKTYILDIRHVPKFNRSASRNV